MTRTTQRPAERAHARAIRASATRTVDVRFPNVCFSVVETAHDVSCGGLPPGCERDNGWTVMRLSRSDAFSVLAWLLDTPQHDPRAQYARRAAECFAGALNFAY